MRVPLRVASVKRFISFSREGTQACQSGLSMITTMRTEWGVAVRSMNLETLYAT